MSPCLGRLKSFLATSTPSIPSQRLSFVRFDRLKLSRHITIYKPSKQLRTIEDSSVVHIPRKRYSWIFLRSSLGISLEDCQLFPFFFFNFKHWDNDIGILTLSRVPSAIRGIAQTTRGKVVCLNDRNDQSGAGTSREKCDLPVSERLLGLAPYHMTCPLLPELLGIKKLTQLSLIEVSAS